MAHLRIEMDRGRGWELRSEGETDATPDAVRASLPGYAMQYPHRALINGVEIARVCPKRSNR